MSLKLIIPCVGSLVVIGGLIGSDFVFKRKTLTNIKDDDDQAWKKKKDVLSNKIAKFSFLSNKISSGDNLEGAIKAWCKKTDKDESEKMHENDLCKEEKEISWLTGR